jgi:hypothetical protein
MPFSMDDLEMLRRDLAQLPPNRPKNVSKHDAVGALASELAAAQRLGYSVEELSELLSEKGLHITPGTLRGYLRRTRKKRPLTKRVPSPRVRLESKSVAPGSSDERTPQRSRNTSPAPPPALPPPTPRLDSSGTGRTVEPAVGKGMANPAGVPGVAIRGAGGS